jgi:predicted AlkP superfamily phosphohydrolase/phosphomutase
MTQVVIIGIDGMDADLLRVYGPSLPNLRRLMLESPFLELKSSFPPAVGPAWGSLYTGLNPANHGLLSSEIVPAPEGNGARPTLRLTCGTTFWDLAGACGKRICVLNPYLAYPSWPVNGLMLSLSPEDGSPSITPEQSDLSLAFPALPPLPPTLDQRQLKELYHELVGCTLQQAALGLELLQREPWDLFFLQLNGLDYIQHIFWRYSDLGDPTYPGRGEHVTRIQSFYRLCDQIISELRSVLGPESVLLVVSAYGHGRRGYQYLNLNEWLREQGLLTAQLHGPRLLDGSYLSGRRRTRPAELPVHFGLAQSAGERQSRESSPARSQSSIIDEDASLARAVRLGGDGPFGGVLLNREHAELQGARYEELRESLRQELTHLRSRGRPLLRWVRRREEVYQGRYLELYPDLLFELQSDFAVGEELYVPLLTTHTAHRLVSGVHRMDGVLLIGNLSQHEASVQEDQEITVMDVPPTVLALLGLGGVRFDGRALIAPRSGRPSS